MSRKGKILADRVNRFLRGSFYISGILKTEWWGCCVLKPMLKY